MNSQSNPSPATEVPVWFITGCSSGFCLELAKQAIERGYRTVVTFRIYGFNTTERNLS